MSPLQILLIVVGLVLVFLGAAGFAAALVMKFGIFAGDPHAWWAVAGAALVVAVGVGLCFWAVW